MLIKSNVSKQQQQISSLNYTNHYYNQNFERIFVEYKSKVFSVNWILVDKLWKIRTMRNTRQEEKVKASADFKALIMLSTGIYLVLSDVNFIIGQRVCAYVHMPAIFLWPHGLICRDFTLQCANYAWNPGGGVQADFKDM